MQFYIGEAREPLRLSFVKDLEWLPLRGELKTLSSSVQKNSSLASIFMISGEMQN